MSERNNNAKKGPKNFGKTYQTALVKDKAKKIIHELLKLCL